MNFKKKRGFISIYKVVYHKSFLKELKSIIQGGDKKIKNRVEEIIEELRKDPHNRRPRVDIKLISSKKEGVYRVRIGRYRMVYQVDEENMIIYITMVFHDTVNFFISSIYYR